MNIPNLRALEAKLREPDTEDHFDMGSWLSDDDNNVSIAESIQDCGTVACIAGFATLLADPKLLSGEANLEARNIAQDWLELTDDEAFDLFSPTNIGDYYEITAAEAADVIANLITTGEVVWPDQTGENQ